jgi:hypothetical protein
MTLQSRKLALVFVFFAGTLYFHAQASFDSCAQLVTGMQHCPEIEAQIQPGACARVAIANSVRLALFSLGACQSEDDRAALEREITLLPDGPLGMNAQLQCYKRLFAKCSNVRATFSPFTVIPMDLTLFPSNAIQESDQLTPYDLIADPWLPGVRFSLVGGALMAGEGVHLGNHAFILLGVEASGRAFFHDPRGGREVFEADLQNDVFVGSGVYWWQRSVPKLIPSKPFPVFKVFNSTPNVYAVRGIRVNVQRVGESLSQ